MIKDLVIEYYVLKAGTLTVKEIIKSVSQEEFWIIVKWYQYKSYSWVSPRLTRNLVEDF